MLYKEAFTIEEVIVIAFKKALSHAEKIGQPLESIAYELLGGGYNCQ